MEPLVGCDDLIDGVGMQGERDAASTTAARRPCVRCDTRRADDVGRAAFGIALERGARGAERLDDVRPRKPVVREQEIPVRSGFPVAHGQSMA